MSSINPTTGLLTGISARSWALALVLGSGAVLCIALVMEHVFELMPCPLCLMQRIWVFFAALAAYIGLLHNPRLGIYPLLTIACALTGAYFSLKQLWLQSLPEDQVPACGPDLAYMFEAFPLTEVIAAMTQGTGDCAEVSFSLFGITLPGWSLLAYLALIAVAILQWRTALTASPENQAS
ncbi:MAG: disulfide bond formation protein B [Pseudomonadota bacterium]